MRVDAVNISPVSYAVMSRVNPIVSTTDASKSGVRPEDLNKMMKMSTYDEKGNMRQSNMVKSFSDIFTGGAIDVKA